MEIGEGERVLGVELELEGCRRWREGEWEEVGTAVEEG
jgi:hypothetical protein